MIAPGGGFSYVGSVHEGFPYAVAIRDQGYNAFVLKYRVGAGGAAATRDLAAAVSYIFRNANTLGVSTEGYSLWGSSAGAAWRLRLGHTGSRAPAATTFPGRQPWSWPTPATRRSRPTNRPPSSSLARTTASHPAVMERRVAALRRTGTEVEFHRYPGLGHGFGPGIGTSAEGWLDRAIGFWEKAIGSKAALSAGRRQAEGRMSVTRPMKKVGAVLAAAVAAAATVACVQLRSRNRGCSSSWRTTRSCPITGELDGQNTRGQLARVNFLRDEPGGRRFFVNDLNGPLYILDKQTKQFTVYLDFNGLGARPGLFPKFTFERNFATGLTNFVFDPDYARNGVFYTLHMEDPIGAGAPAPKSGVVAGLDLTGYTTTPAIPTPTVEGRIEREVVLIEWTDRNPANATFEGTARELLRLQHPLPQHPLGEMTFNPVARRGDPDWRVMYLGAGDSGSGDQSDSRRINPQRLDTLVGKILRIVPDLREHTKTSTVSENGRYRIPNDNPFTTLEGARKEIWAYGLRNPHRLIWDVDPARPKEPRLLAFHIGLVSWETVVVIRKGANYGWPLREGTEARSLEGMGPIPADDTIPIQISDTVTRGTVKPTYPVLQYPHRPAAATPSPTASSIAARRSPR